MESSKPPPNAQRTETVSFEAPPSLPPADVPLESFACTIEDFDEHEVTLKTVSSGGEEGIANMPVKHIPPDQRVEGNRFRIDVLTGGKHRFHFTDRDVRVEKTIARKVDKASFQSAQPDLARWLVEAFQGPADYEVERLDGLSRPVFRIKFSSELFHYVILSSPRFGSREGVMTCTAVPRIPRSGEPDGGYQVSGGGYDATSWYKILQRIAALETMRRTRLFGPGRAV